MNVRFKATATEIRSGRNATAKIIEISVKSKCERACRHIIESAIIVRTVEIAHGIFTIIAGGESYYAHRNLPDISPSPCGPAPADTVRRLPCNTSTPCRADAPYRDNVPHVQQTIAAQMLIFTVLLTPDGGTVFVTYLVI